MTSFYEISADINNYKCDFFKKYVMMKCLHWKICMNPLNQSFPNDQCTFEKNHAWLTNPFKMQIDQ